MSNQLETKPVNGISTIVNKPDRKKHLRVSGPILFRGTNGCVSSGRGWVGGEGEDKWVGIMNEFQIDVNRQFLYSRLTTSLEISKNSK